jgi:dTDP-4-dehydrorhamnose reductase
MKVLVTGANGFTGQHLVKTLVGKGFEVIATSRNESKLPSYNNLTYYNCELTDVRNVENLFDLTKPGAVIHTAAMSKPDECAANPDLCTANNITATQHLLDAAIKVGTNHFVYLSTDFIFGENGPHAEDDTPSPLNLYGASKLEAEALVNAASIKTTIVRPVFMYGPVWENLRPSFIQWVAGKLQKAEPIKVVTDQARTPTYIGDLCWGIQKIIQDQVTGVFHLAGKDIVSPYDMAVAVAKHLNPPLGLIEPVTASTFPEPVKRAQRSGLKIDKAVTKLGYAPHSFAAALQKCFYEEN